MKFSLSGLLWVAGCMLHAAVQATPVADALDRPALPVAMVAKSMLLGAAQAGGRLVAVGERGIVALSDDAGRTWRQAQVPVSVTLTAVRFVDARQGFAVGHGGVVLATHDGGESWRKQLDGAQSAQLVLQAAQASGNPSAVKEAERLVADGADKPLLDLHFFDARRGLVVGAYNQAFATVDGGQTWQVVSDRLDNPKGLHLYAIRSRGDTLVIAGEQGLVYRSDDAGRTFRRLATPYQGSFFTAELPTADEMVVAGLRGNVWRSIDRGVSWSKVEVRIPASFTASADRGERGLVLGNQSGALFAFHGGQLTPLPGGTQPPLTAVLPLANGQLLALGRAGAIVLDATNERTTP